jgi:ZIP family zinc transporter
VGFGAGVLIGALAFELTEESLHRGGTLPAAGGVSFYAGDWVLDHRGANRRRRSGGQQQGGSAGAIVLGGRRVHPGVRRRTIRTMLANTLSG